MKHDMLLNSKNSYNLLAKIIRKYNNVFFKNKTKKRKIEKIENIQG